MKAVFSHVYLPRHTKDLVALTNRQRRDEALQADQVRLYFGNGVRTGCRGSTLCEIRAEDGTVMASGYAFCSINDQFSRRIGRVVSEGRARAALGRRLEAVDASYTGAGG